MIQIATIHANFKHVWTCWNMSKLVQIQYDIYCYNSYDSQTCLNLFRINMMQYTIRFDAIQFQTCLNLFRINMIWIDTILKHVKTWNQNMTKYSKKIKKCFFPDGKAIPWIAASRSSDQKQKNWYFDWINILQLW